MGKLHDQATSQRALREAWYRIRSNGNRSRLPETHDAIEAFSVHAEDYLRSMQRELRKRSFIFAPQKGVLKAKSSGGHRGLVMAPVRNRIVERAWLDCLQDHVPFVNEVITTKTSVGGVPDRSVPHGLAQIYEAFQGKKLCFIRAGISGFFDNIPRAKVIDRLAKHVDDTNFLQTLSAATSVSLVNEAELGEDRRVFPTDDVGVAQGSPLSPLFGNILLYEFDRQFNGRGIVCIRFIDDFVILGRQMADVRKTFERARQFLLELGLRCHNPFVPGTPKEKAQMAPPPTGLSSWATIFSPICSSRPLARGLSSFRKLTCTFGAERELLSRSFARKTALRADSGMCKLSIYLIAFYAAGVARSLTPTHRGQWRVSTRRSTRR